MLHRSIMPCRTRLQKILCKPLSYDPPKHFDAAAHRSCLQIGALTSLHCTWCLLQACLKAHQSAQDARDVSVILLSTQNTQMTIRAGSLKRNSSERRGLINKTDMVECLNR